MKDDNLLFEPIRYADSIIINDGYDALYVHGVVGINKDISDTDIRTECTVDDANPQFYSVYARKKGSDCNMDAVGDFPDYGGAIDYAAELSREYGWPIFDYAGAHKTIHDGKVDSLELQSFTIQHPVRLNFPPNIDGAGITDFLNEQNAELYISYNSTKSEPPDIYTVFVHLPDLGTEYLGKLPSDFRYYKDALQFAEELTVRHKLESVTNFVNQEWRGNGIEGGSSCTSAHSRPSGSSPIWMCMCWPSSSAARF